jgi:ATP-dependent helicase/nuclease subunit A
VLKLLLGREDVSPERIVLMTFTEKAAGEIADRIHQALAEIELQLDSGDSAAWPVGSAHPLFTVAPADREAARRACETQLSRVDAIRSQTIHSFCQSLLRAYPIEAGLDPQFKIVEGFERSLLYSRLYDAWVDEETRTRPTAASLQEWELLLAHFGYLFMIREQVFELLARRDLLVEPSLDFGDIDLVEPQLLDAIAAIRRTDTSAIEDDAAATIFRYVKANEPPSGSVDAWIDYFAPIGKALRKANLPKNAVLNSAIRVFRTDAGKSKPIYDRLVAHRSAVALYSLTRRSIDFLDREKRLLGVADFDDLLLRAEALLENGDVLQRIRSQFDVMFVDEFQDTDRTQARIIERLATDSSGKWVPGKLIVVGDPKQSIYGFRRADPETYRSITNSLLNAGAELRVLEEQYRSDAPLVDAINSIFSAVFSGTDSDPNVFKPPYRPLKSAKAGLDRDLDARVTFLHSRSNDASDRHIVEAEAMAAWIKASRDGVERDLQRFAILFRRLTRIDDYLDVFDRDGIEYVLPSTKDFLERRAPVDLLAVLRAIAFPFDRGAEVSAARTPYFALTDDEIAEGMLAEDASGAVPQTWAAYKQALAQYREQARHLTVAGTVDLLVNITGIESVYDSVADARKARRHLDRVRAIAFEYDSKIGGSIREFVDEIDRRREDPDEVEPSLADDDSNAVRILSVHAAKGLEFETVILPDLKFTSSGRESTQMFAVEEPRTVLMAGRAEALSAHYRYTSAGTPLSKVASEREKAELRRLFYVAVTRAKTDVVFVCNTAAFAKAGFLGTLIETFAFEKDGFDAMWDGEEIKTVRGVTVRFSGAPPTPAAHGLEIAAEVGGAPQRLLDAQLQAQLATGPLLPADITIPPQAETISATEAAQLRASSRNRGAGILLHRVLERWDGSSDLAPLMEKLASEAAADGETVSKLRQRMLSLRRSPSLQRITAAETVGRELPIRFVDEAGAVVERRIDRLILENGRELVVDYKSGNPNEGRLEKDREQVKRYSRAIAAMTGRPCGGLLWYIDVGVDELIEVAQ